MNHIIQEAKAMSLKEALTSNFEQLTKSQKKTAKYILDKYEDVSYLTAREIGEKVGVSEASVLRLSYGLGYENFAAMKKDMRHSPYNEDKSLFGNGKELERKGSFMNSFMGDQVQRLNKAYSRINSSELDIICALLMQKKRILIIGFMDSFGIAAELLHLLETLRKRVYFSKLAYENAYIVDEIDEESATVIVSFSPHYQATLTQAQEVKEKGSTTILISDSVVTPFNSISDHTLIFNLDSNREACLVDTSPVHSFLYHLANRLFEENKEEVLEYMKTSRRSREIFVDE